MFLQKVSCSYKKYRILTKNIGFLQKVSGSYKKNIGFLQKVTESYKKYRVSSYLQKVSSSLKSIDFLLKVSGSYKKYRVLTKISGSYIKCRFLAKIIGFLQKISIGFLQNIYWVPSKISGILQNILGSYKN